MSKILIFGLLFVIIIIVAVIIYKRKQKQKQNENENETQNKKKNNIIKKIINNPFLLGCTLGSIGGAGYQISKPEDRSIIDGAVGGCLFGGIGGGGLLFSTALMPKKKRRAFLS